MASRLRNYPKAGVLRFFLLLSIVLLVTEIHGQDHRISNVLESINRIRTTKGIPPLSMDRNASTAASKHAVELADRRVLSHRGKDGLRVLERYRMSGGTGLRAGENLGAGDSVESIFEAWRNSPSHNENMLNPQWTVIGIGDEEIAGRRIILVAVFSNSRWVDDSMDVENDTVRLTGRIRMTDALLSPEWYLILGSQGYPGRPVGPVSHGLRTFSFEFPLPPEWEQERPTLGTLEFRLSDYVVQTDLLFLSPP